MSDFVTSNDVFVNQHAESRDEVLRFISQKAVELGVTDDADAVYKAFIAREDMGETGMTDGFAVPHAKDAAIKKAAVIVFKNDLPSTRSPSTLPSRCWFPPARLAPRTSSCCPRPPSCS